MVVTFEMFNTTYNTAPLYNYIHTTYALILYFQSGMTVFID